MNAIGAQIQQLAKLFKETKTAYALLGGVAVSYYGVPRMTFDVDVNVLLDSGDVEGFIQQAEKYGFKPIPDNIKSFVKQTGVLPMRFSGKKAQGRCDLIIAQNALEVAGIQRAVSRSIYRTKIRMIACEDLVLHKIASDRPRDLEDLRDILENQREKW